jgi:hypothetical protein
MADTGDDREIKQRVNAHQKEVVRKMKALVQTAKRVVGEKQSAKSQRKPSQHNYGCRFRDCPLTDFRGLK